MNEPQTTEILPIQFYHAENCNRSRHTAHLTGIQFAPYDLVGTWMGVFATNNPEQIKQLDPLVNHGKKGVTKISEAEYLVCLKKKMSAQGGYCASLAQSTPTPGAPVANSALDTRPIDPQRPSQPAEIVEPLKSADEATNVSPIKGRGRVSKVE